MKVWSCALLTLLLTLSGFGQPESSHVDAIASLEKQIEASTLDFESARSIESGVIDLEAGQIEVEKGILIPATPVDGRRLEFVFIGDAVVKVTPPNWIEKEQLEQWGGTSQIEDPFNEFVLVSAEMENSELYAAGQSAILTANQQADALTRYSRWREHVIVGGFAVDYGLRRLASKDPELPDYAVAWGHQGWNDGLLLLRDPSDSEALTVGTSIPTEEFLDVYANLFLDEETEGEEQEEGGADESEAEEDEKDRAKTRDKVLMKWARSDSGDGRGLGADEYRLDTTIRPESLALEGKAKVRVSAGRPTRVLQFHLSKALEVAAVTDENGEALPFYRRGDGYRVDVFLPTEVPEGESLDLTVEYSGEALVEASEAVRLDETLLWYPRTIAQRSLFQGMFRWPSEYQLLSSGKIVEQGTSEDGMNWQLTRLAMPSLGYSFEVGHFDIHREKMGVFEFTVAFNEKAEPRVTPRVKQAVITTTKAALANYSRRFGLYPIPHFTLVTTPRGGSQGLLGFTTISQNLMIDIEAEAARGRVVGASREYDTVEAQRDEIVAHEIAHQWWGNMVGWASYRDQWLSESLAEYSAREFAFQIQPERFDSMSKHGEKWRASLESPSERGLTYEHGPVVMGVRLQYVDAYVDVVYTKGSVVFDSLKQIFGAKEMDLILGEIVKQADGGVISTEDFFEIMGDVSGRNVDGFLNRFVYGKQIPEIHYSYEVGHGANDYVVFGQFEQFHRATWRYGIRKAESGWEIYRTPQPSSDDDTDWSLAIPVAAYREPSFQTVLAARDTDDEKMMGLVKTTKRQGSFKQSFSKRPHNFMFDPYGQVFAYFVSETDDPVVSAHLRAAHLAASGEADKGIGLLRTRALPEVDVERLDYRARSARAAAELELARLYVDQGNLKEARKHVRNAESIAKKLGARKSRAAMLLRARMELIQGNPRVAAAKVERAFRDGAYSWNPDYSRLRLDSLEAALILAIAAQETGDVNKAGRSLFIARLYNADTDEYWSWLSKQEGFDKR